MPASGSCNYIHRPLQRPTRFLIEKDMRLCIWADIFLFSMLLIAVKFGDGHRTTPLGIDLNKSPPRPSHADQSKAVLDSSEPPQENSDDPVDHRKRRLKSQKNLISSRERMQKAKTGNPHELMTWKRNDHRKHTVTKFEYVAHHREMRRRQLANRMSVESVRKAYNEKRRLQYHNDRDRISARRKIKRKLKQSEQSTVVDTPQGSELEAPLDTQKRNWLTNDANVLTKRALDGRPDFDLNELPPSSPSDNDLMPRPQAKAGDKDTRGHKHQEQIRTNRCGSTSARMQRAHQVAPDALVSLDSADQVKASSMTNDDYVQKRSAQFAKSRAKRMLQPGFRESEKSRRRSYYDKNRDAVLEHARQRYHENRQHISHKRKERRLLKKEQEQTALMNKPTASSTSPPTVFFDRSRSAAALYWRRQRVTKGDVLRANAHALSQATSSQSVAKEQRAPSQSTTKPPDNLSSAVKRSLDSLTTNYPLWTQYESSHTANVCPSRLALIGFIGGDGGEGDLPNLSNPFTRRANEEDAERSAFNFDLNKSPPPSPSPEQDKFLPVSEAPARKKRPRKGERDEEKARLTLAKERAWRQVRLKRARESAPDDIVVLSRRPADELPKTNEQYLANLRSRHAINQARRRERADVRQAERKRDSAYYAIHREAIRTKHRARYLRDREKILAKNREYKKRISERRRAARNADCQKL